MGSARSYPAIIERLRDLGMEDDPSFEAEILGDFVADSERVLDALRKAVADADAGACERLAHRIKGGSQNLGATEMSEPAQELEIAGRAGDLRNAGPLLDALLSEFGSIRLFIESHIRELEGRP